MTVEDPLQTLLELSHRIGRRGDLAILAEGNTSIRTGENTFLVKASGHSLAELTPAGVVRCRMEPLLAAVASEAAMSEVEVEAALLEAVRGEGARPSVEAFFHAVLLARVGVSVVAHAHPEEVVGVLCSPGAERFADERRFPDEVVCCGPRSLLLPYVDPGLMLARVLWRALPPAGEPTPEVILLGQHGVICAAATAGGAWTALAMTVKAARVFRLAAEMGGPTAMPEAEVQRIHHRRDEAHRRKHLGR